MDTKWLIGRLEARGKSIASLARAVGRDRAAMSRIVNGDQPLQLWMTPIISAELGVSEAELLSRTGELTMPKLSAAPLIPWHAVGAFAMTGQRVEVSPNYQRILVPVESDTLIALRIEGDAMSACFPDGSIIVIDYAEKDMNDNDIAVFATGEKSVLRRYHIHRKRQWLTKDGITGRDAEEPMGEVVGRVVSAPFISRYA